MTKNYVKLGKTVVAAALVLGMVPALTSCGSDEKDVAEKFVVALLDGKGEKAAKYAGDTFKERTYSKTDKLFEKKMQDNSEDLVEDYKDKYGKKWKYKLEVIDSYDYEADEYYMSQYEGDEVKVVVVEVTHKGSGLFNKKEGSEEYNIYVEKVDGDWVVANMS